MRRFHLIPLAILIVIAIASVAQAGRYGGWGGCGGPQQAIESLSSEKQEAVTTAFEAFGQKTEPMRDEMWALHTELDALSRAGASEQKISEIVQKMRALRTDIRAERKALDAKLAEIGVPRGARGGCPGFGGQGMGPHHGRGGRGGCVGYGGHGGPGNCPGARY